MVILSDEISPNYENKISNALKAKKIIHQVIFNSSKALPGETLRIPTPKLDYGVVLVPGSFALIFNLDVKGHVNNYVVNNVSRSLVERMTVKYAGEILQDTDGFDLLKLYEDLLLTEKERVYHSRPQSPSRPLAGGAWAHDTKGSGDTRNSNFLIG